MRSANQQDLDGCQAFRVNRLYEKVLRYCKYVGFSLIELLIAVAIVAIIATIAYPSYLGQIQKSRRADAKSALVELAQFMEHTYTENKTYQSGGVTPGLPFTESPRDGSDKYYDLTLSAISANSFTLSAAPKNAHSGDPCGTLTLTNAGVKGVSGGTLTADQCW